jgi:hypothetical protein
MTHADCARTVCEGAAAVAAIIAAISWRAAARRPVALYAGTGYGGSSPNVAINEEIQRGAALNARAATWAAVSALSQGLALLIGIAWR